VDTTGRFGGAVVTRRLPGNFAERVRGMILGVAIGDALGWPQEQRSNIVGGDKARRVEPALQFRAWQRNSGSRFARYQETVEAGEYSDDTQLMLAVARSYLREQDHWLRWLCYVELPAWTLYQRGAGRAALSAARRWSEGYEPWQQPNVKGSARQTSDPVSAYFGAGANGVAMRIAPHVPVTAEDERPGELLHRVIADGIATHGHSRALVGAAVHALALRHALLQSGTLAYGDLIESLLDDQSWQRADLLERNAPRSWLVSYERTTGHEPKFDWTTTVAETKELLLVAHQSLAKGALANDEQTLDRLGCFDKRRNGAGTITAVGAAYLAARAAARPASGLLRSAFLLRADTDTLASMTASLLGAVHGTAWCQPLDTEVQDAQYLLSIADQLGTYKARNSMPLFDLPAGVPPDKRVDVKDLEKFKERALHMQSPLTRFVDGRKIAHADNSRLATERNIVDRLRLRMTDAQTLVIDRLMRSDSSASSVAGQMTPERPHKAVTSQPDPAIIQQVRLAVRNLRRSIAFYRDVLGVHVELLGEDSAQVAHWLVLVQRTRSTDSVASNGRHLLLTIGVERLAPVLERLRASEHGELLGTSEVDGLQQLRLRDPDGNDLLIVERHGLTR